MVKISIKVKPNSFKDEILFIGDELTVKLRAKPIDGEANNSLIHFLAKELAIPKSSIQISKGATNSFKQLTIGIDKTKWELFKRELMSKG